jgi:hypothetical protein
MGYCGIYISDKPRTEQKPNSKLLITANNFYLYLSCDPPTRGLGVGLTTPHRKKISVTKCQKGHGRGRILRINDLCYGKWTCD